MSPNTPPLLEQQIDAKSLALAGGLHPSSTQQLQPLQHPPAGGPTQEWVQELQRTLLLASWHQDGVMATSQVLPSSLCDHILRQALPVIKKEPTLLELNPSAQQLHVTVVGDTHGHFQDVCNMFELYGRPSPDRVMIFNGDFVDRGAWGLETLVLLLAYKWLLPRNVYLLRGNHESSWCTKAYGFKAEVMAKYGTAGKALYRDVLRLFAQLPLAAVVEGNTLILHGGLFRVPPAKLERNQSLEDLQLPTGTLSDLRADKKGSVDPSPDRKLQQLLASDVLWSDPSNLPGHVDNHLRGVGTRFGPDVTEAFLSSNKLKLIIRSHEGPDARHKRPENDRMPPVDDGFSIDHETPSGKLVTLFSAPDYPMFQAPCDERFHNKAAVLHLTAPDYATPDVQTFDAVLPRPKAMPFHDVESISTDSEPSCTDSESCEHDVSSSVAASANRQPATSVVAAAAVGKQQQQQQPQDPPSPGELAGCDVQGKRSPKRHRS